MTALFGAVMPCIVKDIADETNVPVNYTVWDDALLQLPVNPTNELHTAVVTVNDDASDTTILVGTILIEGVKFIVKVILLP